MANAETSAARRTTFDVLSPCLTVQTVEQAEAHVEEVIAFHRGRGAVGPLVDLEEQIRDDIAFFAGWYGEDTRRRVEGLYGTPHPYMGRAYEEGATFALDNIDRPSSINTAIVYGITRGLAVLARAQGIPLIRALDLIAEDLDQRLRPLIHRSVTDLARAARFDQPTTSILQ